MKERLVEFIRQKLVAAGWEITPGMPAFALQTFPLLKPSPFITFSVRDKSGTRAGVAVTLEPGPDEQHAWEYVTRICFEKGRVLTEAGWINQETGEQRVRLEPRVYRVE